ncbi:MAG TPA: hypothetical protein VHA12_01805 [Candidatus Nanoarchaeia archaeon]|nr:hypothetical protein [Candidatus Nanoarchaeia archaeon]
MAVNIHNLIAAINPQIYCDESVRKEVAELSEKGEYLKAAEKAKPITPGYIDPDKAYTTAAVDAKWLKDPVEKHELVYDSPGENLEPIYFWILEYLRENKYKNVEKLLDNFISSEGSGHFSEMGMKATKMQEEAMKILGNANTVIKSIINILYDLKEFKTRLEVYNKLKSENPKEKQDGVLSLKQIWMDTVDAKRGNTGLKAMAAQYQYVTLIDAFMACESSEKVQQMDLNERVKRIVESRLKEFEYWMKASEEELKKRFEIEKIYLRSQVSAVQLYARWVKPYLKAARALEQNANGGADVVTNFATTVFELAVIGEGEYKPQEDVDKGDLPEIFSDKEKNKRKYEPYIVVEYKFRTIPGKIQGQNYSFRGRAELTFTSYALNKDEYKVLKEQLLKSDIGDLTSYMEGATEKSLGLIEKEINDYLDEKPKEEKKEDKKDKKNNDDNPFSALASIFTKGFWKGEEKKEDKKEEKKGIEKDNQWEKILRSQAALKGRQECSKFYGEFKKSQNMVG